MENLKTYSLLIICLLLTSCADVSPHTNDCITSNPYGFWSGVWHGIIVPFSIFGRILSDDIAVYALNNNGSWYDVGFVFGVGGLGHWFKLAVKSNN